MSFSQFDTTIGYNPQNGTFTKHSVSWVLVFAQVFIVVGVAFFVGNFINMIG